MLATIPDIWNYFIKDKECKKAKCLLCLKELTFHSGKTNLREHLMNRHSGSTRASESSLLATSYNIDGASSSDESQRDKGSSRSASKDSVSFVTMNFFCVCV